MTISFIIKTPFIHCWELSLVINLVRLSIVMEFSLDNPGFSTTLVASQESETPPPPLGSGSSAAPSSGDSSRRNCPQCRRRMSKTIFDLYTVCHKCWGWDCLIRGVMSVWIGPMRRWSHGGLS